MSGRIVELTSKYGTYIGKANEQKIISFKGIPYAKQPVGTLRWKKAQPLEPGEGIIPAVHFGHTCIQAIDPYEAASLNLQGEDCLSLNIWTRELGDRKRPVMVWIHGGAYVSGGTTDPVYNGENFVRRHDIVMVTINYRTNVFGFLNLEEMGGSEYADSANLGILDQVQALAWIHENISQFGGDPGNVTIFGESCGGASVSILMGVPATKGLFHKVIAQSGAPNLIKRDREFTRQLARDFVAITGTKTMDELLALTADQIRDFNNQLAEQYMPDATIGFPIVDGVNIPEDPYISIKNGLSAGVKLLAGTNQDEINYWKMYMGEYFYEGAVEGFGDATYKAAGLDVEKHKEAIDEFLNSPNSLNPEEPYGPANLVNDLGFRIPAIKQVEYQAPHGDTYMYFFKWKSPVPGMGCTHAMDLPFVFHNLEHTYPDWLGTDPLPEALADNLQDAWVAFATTGNPSIKQAPFWEKYDTKDRATMVIDDKKWELVNDPGKKERVLLDPLYEIYEK